MNNVRLRVTGLTADLFCVCLYDVREVTLASCIDKYTVYKIGPNKPGYVFNGLRL